MEQARYELHTEFGQTFGGMAIDDYNSYSTIVGATWGNVLPSGCRSLWVRNTTLLVADPVQVTTLLKFAVSKMVCTLYLESDNLVGTVSGKTALASFIREASLSGIDVEILLGQDQDVLEFNHPAFLYNVQAALQFMRYPIECKV